MEEAINIRQGLPVRGLEQKAPLAIDLKAVFYFFVASIPAETYPLFSNYSIPQILGVVFIVIVTIRGRLLLQMPKIHFWLFSLYYAVVLLSIKWLNPSLLNEWQKRIIQFGQLLIFFWLMSILLKYKDLTKGALTAYSYSLTLFITLAYLRVPGFVSGLAIETYGQRATIGEADPNGFAVKAGVALLFFLDELLSKYEKFGKFNKILLILIIYMIFVIIQTQSRGGQIAVLCGLITFFGTCNYKYNKRKLIIFGIILLAGFSSYSYFKPNMRERWQSTIREGEMSSREKFFPESIKMIREKPFIGWGVGEHLYVLGARTERFQRDPHNSFIWVIHEVGLLGGLPYCVGFFLCGITAFRKRKGMAGNVPFALWVIMAVASLDLTMLYIKATWFVLSLCVAGFKKHH